MPYSYRYDSQVPSFPDDRPIIVFDGYCALCSGWAALILRHDKRGHYRLVTAQSALGQALYRHFNLDPHDYETNVLIEYGVPWFRSTGSLKMLIGLGWPWRAAGILMLLPLPLRDWLYKRLARNRLRWFGRRHDCYVPTAVDRARFLE